MNVSPADDENPADDEQPALRVNPTDKFHTQSRQAGMVATEADVAFYHGPEQHGESTAVYRIDVPTVTRDVLDIIDDVSMPQKIRDAIRASVLAKLPTTHVQILVPEGHVLPMMWVLLLKRYGTDDRLRYRYGMIAQVHKADTQ